MNFYLGIQRITIPSTHRPIDEGKSKILRSNTVSACQFEPELLLLTVQTARSVFQVQRLWFVFASWSKPSYRVNLAAAWFGGSRRRRNCETNENWVFNDWHIQLNWCFARYLSLACGPARSHTATYTNTPATFEPNVYISFFIFDFIYDGAMDCTSCHAINRSQIVFGFGSHYSAALFMLRHFEIE